MAVLRAVSMRLPVVGSRFPSSRHCPSRYDESVTFETRVSGSGAGSGWRSRRVTSAQRRKRSLACLTFQPVTSARTAGSSST